MKWAACAVTASSAASRMYSIIEDVLEYSTINDFKNSTNIEEVDLNEIVSQVTQGLKIVLEEKKAAVISTALPTIFSKKRLIFSLFQKLIENGLKYNKSENPIVRVEYYKLNDNHVFTITDNGIGIEEKYHANVFEMFRRLHNFEEYQGSGIGLAICKRAVELMGGKITLKSSLGKGSTFTITIQEKARTFAWALVNEELEENAVVQAL